MISYIYITFLLIIAIHATLYNPPAGKCPQEDSLRKCLDQHHIKGLINFRDNFVGYNKDINFEYNMLIVRFPVAFVHPANILDIQNTIKCGVKLNYPVVARSGGHSFESYSLGDKDCYLVIDLVNFNKVTINITSQTALIETGNLVKLLHYELNPHSFAFPAGVCSQLGIGGLALGGGVGFLNRKFGLASDNILDAQIVLANGSIVNNVKEYPELFWAIRGAGNVGYGIVTTLTLRIYPVPRIVTWFEFEYDLDQTPFILSVINQLAPKLDRNLSFVTELTILTKVHGIYQGSVYELQPHIKEFIKLSNPKSVTYYENELYNIIDVKMTESKRGYYKAKSFFIDSKGISYEGVMYILKFVKSFGCKLYFNIMFIGGGKVSDIGRNETAFVHRGLLYHVEIKAFVHSEACIDELERFSQEFRQKYANFESYQNINDRLLDNWQCRYYRENFNKLVEIKRKYDPDNLFRWNQSIPTDTVISCD
ncbi:FAD-binding domain-containing protein [Gigaspora margarita]|uniref:FAD-binding domain-containing protein n=1 Tax=Gigaspora margarita TaxID=4874 RepID=A0A8H3ZYQ8_GIGMA|nr:FAD-binding domain-containing protein [Gigaspora margarita]